MGVLHNPTGSPLTVDLSGATDIRLSTVAAVLGAADEGFAELSGTELTIGAMTSAVLRAE